MQPLVVGKLESFNYRSAALFNKEGHFKKYDREMLQKMLQKNVKVIDEIIDNKLINEGLVIKNKDTIPQSFYQALKKASKNSVKETGIDFLPIKEKEIRKGDSNFKYIVTQNGYAISDACYIVEYSHGKIKNVEKTEKLTNFIEKYKAYQVKIINLYEKYQWDPILDDIIYALENNEFVTQKALVCALRGINYSIPVKIKSKNVKPYAHYSENEINQILDSFIKQGFVVENFHRRKRAADYYSIHLKPEFHGVLRVKFNGNRKLKEIERDLSKKKKVAYPEYVEVINNYKKLKSDDKMTMKSYISQFNYYVLI